MRLLVSLLAILSIQLNQSSADTVTLTPSADTCLFEFDPSNNWGAEPEFVAGALGNNGNGARCRSLLKFDLTAAIPAGSTITAAQLTMTVTNQPSSAPSTNFLLLRNLLPWEEGTQDGPNPGGSPAVDGETTWNHRIHPATTWTSPGGTLEVDFAEDPSASLIVSNNPTNIFTFNPLGISDLNSMLSNPAANFGWVFLAQNETVRFSARRWGSREHPTTPPSLQITFTPPAIPVTPTILQTNLDSITGNLSVEVEVKAGQTYTLESRTDLTSGSWIPVDTEVITTDGSTTLSTTVTLPIARSFFRISSILTP